MKPKVAFLVHMLAPYRVTFYQKLFSSNDYNWKLFAGYKSNINEARPQYEGKVDFPLSYHKEKISKGIIYNRIDLDNMFEAVKKFDPQIIIMFAHIGTKSFRDILIWAKASNIKVIMWTCFWEPYYISGYKRIIRNLIIKSYYTKADYHITYSTTAREKLIKIGYPGDQISIAFNGIDINEYNKQQIPEISDKLIKSNGINFLYCGGFGKDKKVELLINAVNKIINKSNQNINVYLIGDGPMFNECEKLITKLSLSNSIEMLGRVKNAEKYFIAADCIVMPGTGGLLLNEAILFNKPFIASDADGTEYDLLINGFNAIKFLRDDEVSLANALEEMCENLSFFKENAKATTGLVTKRSNVDSMVSTFLKVLKKIKYN